MRKDFTKDIDRAVEWFKSQGMTEITSTQEKALRELFDHCMQSEWVRMWSDESIELLIDEGADMEYVQAPYFTTSGEPLGKGEG